jgi:thimet oligopeptidase
MRACLDQNAQYRFALPALVALTGCVPLNKANFPMSESAPIQRLDVEQAASLLSTSAAEFEASCERARTEAGRSILALKGLGSQDVGQLLAHYDRAVMLLGNFAQRAALAKEVHPDQAFRTTAEQCEQRIEADNVTLSLDQALYRRLAAIDASALPADTAFWLQKVRREFERAGVDRDAKTRDTVRQLNEQLVKLGQAFGRNIRDDVRSIRVLKDDLAGLPLDWLQAHPADPEGYVSISTNTPDYLPVMTYAHKPKVREALWRAYRQRAFPANVKVLNDMLSTRHQLATLLGFGSWADYVTETKMVKNAANAEAFIESGLQATSTRAQADYGALLARKRKDIASATTLEPWDFAFYEDRVTQERFGFDSVGLRAYFEYDTVKRGLMNTVAQLFSIRFERRPDAVTWHQDVETYDVFDGRRLIGRIHLDMHPRDNKYQHAAQFGLTTGVLHQSLPEAVLVCNFPRAGGLLQHSDVETIFHEFGHLMHEIFSGQQRFSGISGIKTEWDFVEVPSMLLQEWPLDGTVLSTFAAHHQTGKPIPEALVNQLRAAKQFGIGLSQRRQFFLSAVSLAFHQQPPGFDTTAMLKSIQHRFAPIRPEWIDGSHFELSFGHLDGYSAIYYTYQWSTVIAKDLLAKFRDQGLLNSTLATEYRHQVLEPGGSKPAADMLNAFLGRPTSFDAYQQWLATP